MKFLILTRSSIAVIFILLLLASCKKEEDKKASNASTTCIDADGNSYKTIKIGDQVWMAENLRTTKLNNGTPITEITSDNQLIELIKTGKVSQPHLTYYEFEHSKSQPYGILYGRHAVNSNALAPKGWHIPSQAEWEKLCSHLGGQSIAGGKMKVIENWEAPNVDASNSSGFSAYGGGEALIIIDSFAGTRMDFWWIRTGTSFWTSNQTTATDNTIVKLSRAHGSADFDNSGWENGSLYSVRCVKD